MNKDFSCEASKLAWQLFESTGKLCYYSLFANIENPPPEITIQTVRDDGREM